MGWRGRGSGVTRGSLCERCGTKRRGRAARHNAAMTVCGEETCRAQICIKHAVWVDNWYLCTTCARTAGVDLNQP